MTCAKFDHDYSKRIWFIASYMKVISREVNGGCVSYSKMVLRSRIRAIIHSWVLRKTGQLVHSFQFKGQSTEVVLSGHTSIHKRGHKAGSWKIEQHTDWRKSTLWLCQLIVLLCVWGELKWKGVEKALKYRMIFEYYVQYTANLPSDL